MREFEEICKEYGKNPVQVETALFSLLQKKSRGESFIILDHASYGDYLAFLYNKKYLIKGDNILTAKGERAIKRGWIELNIKQYKRHKYIKLTYHILTIVFAAIAAIASIFAACAS